jgi:hypothetical protein
MVLTAEQHLRIAILYEKAAADRLGVPPQQRAAFARKAKWFRMKARIRAKKEAASLPQAERQAAAEFACAEGARAEVARPAASFDGGRLEETVLSEARLVELRGVAEAAPAKTRYRSIAERLASLRGAQG